MSRKKLYESGVITNASLFIRRPLVTAIIGMLTGSLIMGNVLAAEETTKSTAATTQEKPAEEKLAENAATEKSEASATAATTNATPANENKLSSVVVTAQKREESAQTVATAISVLDGKDLLDRGAGRSASEILNYVPNASAGTQQHGRPRWWIRGVGSGQQQIDFPSQVGIYLDDVYISNASATGGPLFDIDRVEVLRGPQGTLWGKNTTGGAINILSKKPTFSGNDNYVKADYGSYNDRIVQGAVGGELVSERVAGRLSFYDQDYGGSFKNLFTGKTDGGLTDSGIRGQLLFELTPNLEALLNVNYRNYKTEGAIYTVQGTGPGGAYVNGYIPSKSNRDVSTNAEDSSESSQNGISLNVKWQLGKLSLTSITAYQDWKSTILTDGDYTPLEISRSYTDADSKQVSQEFRLASPREDRWNWLTGFHYFKEDIDSYAATARLPNGTVPALAGSTAPTSYNYTNFSHKAESYAIFGSTTFNFTEKLDSTLGARWSTEEKTLDLTRRVGAGPTWSNLSSWWDSYSGGLAALGTAGSFSKDLTKRWDAFTYDFTPQYKINETNRVYAKYAHGIKSGGFNSAATLTEALIVVKPETLDSYELGYKSEWLDGRLNFNTAIFYYDYQDVQVNVVGLVPGTASSASYLRNVDKAAVKGIEFEAEALPTNRLHLVANVGLQDSEFKNFTVDTAGGTVDLSGNELVRTPRFNSFVAADYRIPLDNGKKVVFAADWRYVGEQHYFVNAQNTAQNTNYKLLGEDAYSLVNARVSFTTKGDKVEVTGYVNNIFDKEYLNHALPGGRSGAQVATGTVAQWATPRTAGVALTLRF